MKAMSLLIFVSSLWFASYSVLASSQSVDSFLRAHPKVKLKKNFNKEVRSLFGGDENPAFISGDFNGDGKIDQITMEVRSGADYVCIYLAGDTQCKKMPNRDPKRYLSKVDHELVQFRDGRRHSIDLFQVEYLFGAVTAYYIEGRKLVEFSLSHGEVKQ